MNNLIQIVEKEQIKKLTSKKSIPTFRTGDTIKVTLKITEGDRSRLQAFEGMCIARKNNSLNSKFTIRKISHGEGVERVFPLFSPNIDKIEVIRKGDVRRSKLYYLRARTGKSARIADRDRGEETDEYTMVAEESDKDSKENINVKKESKESVETNKENIKVDEQSKNEVSENNVVVEKKEEAPGKSETQSKTSTEKAEQKTDEQSKS